MNSRIKVLIITYYWPPAGGSGVQRWLKFTKYLREFGIEPVIYTVKDAKYPLEDHSLQKDIPEDIEIIKRPIFEPNNFLIRKSPKKNSRNSDIQNQSPSFFVKILQYIRINFFIPDARKFWIRPSVRFLKNYLNKNDIDTIITTGPPHSLHIIGLKLKNKLNLKWISDFRDPWTDIYYNASFNMNKRTLKKQQRLESLVLNKADHIITTNRQLQVLFKNRTDSPVSLITNGFDDEAKNIKKSKTNEGFSLDYMGYLPEESNPITLWRAISELIQENKDFERELRINLTGDINNAVKRSIEEFKLNTKTQFNGYVTHDKVVQMQHNANVLLILIARSETSNQITPGKIFECLQARRPIFAVGPVDGGAAEILKHTNSGQIFDFDDKEGMKKYLLELFDNYVQNKLCVNSVHINAYHRRSLTEKLALIIHKLNSK